MKQRLIAPLRLQMAAGSLRNHPAKQQHPRWMYYSSSSSSHDTNMTI